MSNEFYREIVERVTHYSKPDPVVVYFVSGRGDCCLYTGSLAKAFDIKKLDKTVSSPGKEDWRTPIHAHLMEQSTTGEVAMHIHFNFKTLHLFTSTSHHPKVPKSDIAFLENKVIRDIKELESSMNYQFYRGQNSDHNKKRRRR
jgi:hypothetical protein